MLFIYNLIHLKIIWIYIIFLIYNKKNKDYYYIICVFIIYNLFIFYIIFMFIYIYFFIIINFVV